MIAKVERTQSNAQQKHGTNTEPHNGSNNQQQQNRRLKRTTA